MTSPCSTESWDGGTSLPRHAVRVTLFLWKEHLLDFVVDAHEPCLGAAGAIAKVCGLGLGFAQSLFGCSKLKRELMSQVHGAFAVFVGHVCSLLQHGHDRALGVIGRGTGLLLPFGRRRKRDNGACFVGSIIRTHLTHSAPWMIGSCKAYHSLRRRAGESLASR